MFGGIYLVEVDKEMRREGCRAKLRNDLFIRKTGKDTKVYFRSTRTKVSLFVLICKRKI